MVVTTADLDIEIKRKITDYVMFEASYAQVGSEKFIKVCDDKLIKKVNEMASEYYAFADIEVHMELKDIMQICRTAYC